VALSQTGEEALKKCVRWIKGQPSLVCGVIVNIEEAKAYRTPSSNYIPPIKKDFESKVAGNQFLGASITVKDHELFRERTCAVEVLIPHNNEIESFTRI
jgi:hypothetical protein